MKQGEDVTVELIGLGATGTPKKNKAQDWQKLYNEADAAGNEAVSKCNVVPMVVQQHANVMDDSSPVTQSWYVSDGVCGFAWVTVRPGNCSFAKWLVKNNLARSAYGGGVSIWISQFNQSMQKKECYADAFAKVLRDAGIKAYAGSRMD